MTVDVAENLETVKRRIAEAAHLVGRDAGAVHLIAVSKFHPADRIEAAIEAGHLEFGENRVQEAQSKFPDLKQRHPKLRLHLVGTLQSNKVEDAVKLFDVIQSVDRERLARRIADAAGKHGRCPDLFVQVNIGSEPQKSGVDPNNVEALVTLCRDTLELPVVGLMCIPPLHEGPAPYFALLKKLADENGLNELSMGMSADYETAIKLGATHVRVGEAIFGPRPSA